MKKFLIPFLFTCGFVTPVKANPYIETKTNFDYLNSVYQDNLTHIRFGYEKQIKNIDFHIELGPGYLVDPTGQYSTIGGEIGFDYSLNKHLLFHYKYEGEYVNAQKSLIHGHEMSVRYTF
jgi:hypothetical protein